MHGRAESGLGQLLRRVERLRFASHEGAASAERHARLIALCAARDAEGAARLAAETWQTLTPEPEPEPDTETETETEDPA